MVKMMRAAVKCRKRFHKNIEPELELQGVIKWLAAQSPDEVKSLFWPVFGLCTLFAR